MSCTSEGSKEKVVKIMLLRNNKFKFETSNLIPDIFHECHYNQQLRYPKIRCPHYSRN
jgi:hypothetical protein